VTGMISARFAGGAAIDGSGHGWYGAWRVILTGWVREQPRGMARHGGRGDDSERRRDMGMATHVVAHAMALMSSP